MNVPFLDLSPQEQIIKKERENRFNYIIQNSAFVLGSQVKEFEEVYAAYCGTKYAVGVSGGTDALTMIFRALEIGEGDEVVMIPITFIASASATLFAGATPVFVDIDRSTRDFNYEALEQAITPQTKAILAVHLYGMPCDMDKLLAIAEKYKIYVIEDACQSHGAIYKGRKTGSFAVAAAFSFYPGKNLGAYGDGGAVTTNDEQLAQKIRALRNQGCVEKYDHTYLGFNGRLDALQAAVVIEKLKHLDNWNMERRHIADTYTTAFEKLSLELPPRQEHADAAWHLYVVAVKNRETFINHLTSRGVSTGIHYPIPLHLTPALSHLKYSKGAFPEAERLSKSCVSLPLYPGMKDEQIRQVIEAVTSFAYEN